MDAGRLPKRILVLGARGFLGEHIVQQLLLTGCQVIAAVRPGSRHAFSSPRVTVIAGDLRDAAFLRAALERADAAIFAAGRVWRPGLALEEYHRQNVGIVEPFFAALGRHREMRVVFTSSLATLSGSRTPHVFAEDGDRGAVCERWLTPYARAKIACERLALDSAGRGHHVVVLNPGQLLGPGVHAGSNLATAFVLLWFCRGQAPFYVRGGTTYSDVRDVARAHVAALGQGRSGRRYILGGHCLARGEFYGRVAGLVGLRAPRGVPARLVHLVMALADGLAFLSAGAFRSPVHRTFARGEGLYYYGDSQRAASELDYRIAPLERTILDTLRDYHARGLLPAALDFVAEVPADDAPAFVRLRRLAEGSVYSRFLLARMPRVYALCRANRDLSAALTRLADVSRPDRSRAAADRRHLIRFFEYLYFASDEFLREVE
jgi:dihydroflavonol-4-reductase